LAAALVLQERRDQEAYYLRLAQDEAMVEPPGTGSSALNDNGGAKRILVLSAGARAVAKVAMPLLVLLIVFVFALTQVWHREQPHTVAAASRMSRPSEGLVRNGRQFGATPQEQISHMRVTDRGVLSEVESLSKFEIPALRRQARYGDDSAALLIGMLYETGHFVPRSCTQAAVWVTASANAGNAAAQYNLGLRYRDGDGVPANRDEAEKWLREAADRRYADARLALEVLPQSDAGATYTPPAIADALPAGSK
jgi:hypothetical protein